MSQAGVLNELPHYSLGKCVQASMHELFGLLQLPLLGQETAALDQRLKFLLPPENARQHHFICSEEVP